MRQKLILICFFFFSIYNANSQITSIMKCGMFNFLKNKGSFINYECKDISNFDNFFYSEVLYDSNEVVIVKFSEHSTHAIWKLYLTSADSTSIIECEKFTLDWFKIDYFLSQATDVIKLNLVTKLIYCYAFNEEPKLPNLINK